MESKQSPSDENPNHEDHLAGDLVGDGVAPIETKTHADSSDKVSDVGDAETAAVLRATEGDIALDAVNAGNAGIDASSADRQSYRSDTERQADDAMAYSQQMSMQSTTPPSNVPGYRLTRFLGAGAFGQVWVGRDMNTGRDVAVKFYLHRGGVNWSLLSREVKNLVQLSADRYVVQVLEVGWDAEPPYYVMELIAGGSLQDYLDTHDRLPVEEAVELFRKICLGLNRCHAKGVLHCDLKPANLLLGDDNEPRLADFGQSRLTGDQTPALGTLFYMAPEQANLNAAPDASWDVYAVGAIFYRLLTGRPPHRDQGTLDELDTANSLEERLSSYRHMIMRRGAPYLLSERDGVDRPLARIVARCLAPKPEDRFANVQQILQELGRREAFRTKRPLMLLGIVGPLLILIATSVFAARTVRQASKSTVSALRQEAFGSNELAAAFAAKTLEGEIDRYYRVTEEEATSEDLKEVLNRCRDDVEFMSALEAINSMGSASASHGETEPRSRLLTSRRRRDLKSFLESRLKAYQLSEGRQLASMFVTDSKGTIMAIAYDSPVRDSQDSSGRNYCYRTYFHGGRRDLPKETTEIGSVSALRETRMSAAFSSTATQLWKVAVSTPIFLTEGTTEPDAMFVITVNLGDFELLQSRYGTNQVAVLVEARSGPTLGTILQHPMIETRRRNGADMTGERYQIPPDLMARLFDGRDVDYLDPLSNADGGDAYDGQWIAAMQPVSLPKRSRVPNGEQQVDDPESQQISDLGLDSQVLSPAEGKQESSETTDLLVLVQYRLQKVISPVSGMRSALLWEGAFALVSILLVTLGLWWVVRKFSAPVVSLERDSSPSNETTETVRAR